ncbi:MAG: kelch motif-containing protein, partial [Candidatus Omnitrophica bacterium]|nr:kelch motif-containing protein [Candidatus Omnitrophota bacterium]
MSRLAKETIWIKKVSLFTGMLTLTALVGLGVFVSIKEHGVQKREAFPINFMDVPNGEELIKFAETFLPMPEEGTITQQDKSIIYKRTLASEYKQPQVKKIYEYEAVFKEESADIWIRREDSAFGVGMKAILFSPIPSGNNKYPVISTVRNKRIIYNLASAAMVYTPLDNGVREDILVASPQDLSQLPLVWQLDLDNHTEARMEQDGTIGIYGPEKYLWSNIQIGDEKSAKLIEQARKNTPKTELLYKIPLPVIREANGKEHRDISTFTLEGKTLALEIHGYKDLVYPISIDPSIVITLTADFMTQGNNEGMVSLSENKISREKPSGGETSSWSSTTSLPAARRGHTSVAYNGYLYVLGGFDGSSYRNTVRY